MTKWTLTSETPPNFGQPIIGMIPVNKGMNSEYWRPVAMTRLNVRTALPLYPTVDPAEFEIDEWYSPLSDIQDDCTAPMVWAAFDYPSKLPSELPAPKGDTG